MKPTTPSERREAPALSVAIVCKNNEKSIGRTLESVRGLAREIVAVDSGSTDRTMEILSEHGARIIESAWLGFGPTKQMAQDACEGAWILSLDSDESLEPALRESVRAAVERDDPSIAGYEVNRKIFYAGRFLNHAWQPEWRLRLVRAGKARWGGYDPHESLFLTEGRSARLRGDLRHDSFRTIEEHLARQVRYGRAAAVSYQRLGRRGSVVRLATSPVGAWLKQMVLRRAFLDGWRGWCAAATAAAGTLAKHAVLLERTRAPDLHDESERP